MRTFFVLLLVLCLATVGLTDGRWSTPSVRPAGTTVRVEVEGRGDFTIRFFDDKAPKTTSHILSLVRRNFYDGQRFHRVEKSPKPFLVQIGDPASRNNDLSGAGGSNAEIAYEESGVRNVAGMVGLGHPVDEPDKGDSQFYVLLDNAGFLDGKYTVFGQVISGMDVVKRIQRGDRVTRISVIP